MNTKVREKRVAGRRELKEDDGSLHENK